MKRALTAEEAELWKRVIATVKPIVKAKTPVAEKAAAGDGSAAVAKPPARLFPEKVKAAPKRAAPPAPPKPAPKKEESANTLDGSWDRRLSRGLVAPESTVDLHGHTLSSAYDRLDRGLDHAVQRGDRVLLLVTGKPPRPESERPHARGAIRAAVGDWLASSRHSDRIAAVRGAHPRHGGSGALYIVLRRSKTAPPKIS